MASMTMKERFLATLRFGELDRPWRFETLGYWEETIERWHSEGLPRYVFNATVAVPYFGIDFWVPVWIGAHEDPGFFPHFIPKVLEQKDNFEIVRDFSGKTFKQFRDGSSSIPQHVDSPVKTLHDFKRLRWRLNPDFPGRCDNPLWDSAILASKVIKAPLGIHFSGLFGFHRHLIGVEQLMYMYFDNPELIHAMGREWAKLTKGVVRRISRKGDVNILIFWEDMSFKSGPLISPNTFKKFLTPYYKEVIDDAKECGVECFTVDTDGDCTLLIPLFIDVGVNCMYPFEVQAGMDIRKVRADWGRQLMIMGGLDKLKLENSTDEIDREVMLKVPEMLSQGGYVPGIDHAVHPSVPLSNFKYFVKLLRETKWPGVSV
jgi:hypothetical protein